MIDLNEKFIAEYQDKLEDSVLKHIIADKENEGKQWTLKKAHDYVERMISTLFGTSEHTGIIQYLDEDQGHLELSLNEALSRGEMMIKEGWSVKRENERYFLLDSNFRKVKDVSGSADIDPAPVVSEFGPENCWMLLEEDKAKSLAKQAASHGVDTSLLTSPEFAYQFVVSKLGTENPLFPFVQMYKGMGEILRKLHYFESKDLTSLDELRAEGYRISPRVNPSSSSKSYLSAGSKGYTILPVSDRYFDGKSADSLFVPEAYWKRDLLKSLGVSVDTPIQIGEMGFTFALGFEDNKHYTSVQDLGEEIRIILSIKNQNRAKNYPLFDKLMGQLASVYVVENILVGNSNFTLANVSIDTVTPEVVLRYSSQGRDYTPKEIKYALENAREEGNITDFLTMCSPITDGNLGPVLRALPEEFKTVLGRTTSSDSYIQKNIDTLLEYL